MLRSFFLLFIISTSVLAWTDAQEIEFQKRIKLYGLVETKELISYESNKYDESIKKELETDIRENYIPKLEDHFGHCQNSSCLSTQNDYLQLNLPDKNICLPYTQCEFYKCMEDKYQCDQVGVNYFTELAYPTCSTYKKNLGKKWFSQKGYDWIYTVMVCLQKGLIEECDINDNCQKETQKKTCEYITDFTLKFHPSCYLNSGVGVCNLPFRDKINIWRTVGKYLTTDERRQAFNVVKECIKREL